MPYPFSTPPGEKCGLVTPVKAGIQRLKSLDPGQKNAGMTMFEKLLEFKSIGSFATSKAVWYGSMRLVRDEYSGQQCIQV